MKKVKKKINSRAKGCRGELELAHILSLRGFEAKRGRQFKGSPDSPDIECEALAPFHIECKRVEALSLYKAMSQSEKDCGSHQLPIVMHRKSGQEWLAILKLDDFLALFKKANIKLDSW